MKKIIYIVILFLLSIGFGACQPIEDEPTDIEILTDAFPQNDIYYEIFVRSFADSNQDGIGDLNGITENLDYIADLGVTALWLMPINTSPSYHGYDVTDYYDINPDYGTLADFQNLIDQAASRNIDILIDLVINHTSDQHPWYVSAASSSDSPYRDYYVWNNNTAYESFGGGMKDLNFENPDVITEVENITDFYLNMGVHGFRIDAARHLIESNNQTLDNALLIFELNQHIKEVDPNSFLISEVFEYNYALYTDYYIGSDALFDFSAAYNIWDKVGNGNNRYQLVSNIQKSFGAIRDIKPNFVDAPFISNHDIDRIASMTGFSSFNSFEKLALAARISLTMPGSPFIYYGEEIGMKGERYEGDYITGYGIVYDEYRRQPFIWGEPEYQTSWLPSDGSNDQTVAVSLQMNDQNSLFTQYQEIIKVRRENIALMFGNYFEAYQDNDSNIQGYVRYVEHEGIKQAVLVLHNISPDSRMIDVEFLEILYGDLTIPAFGTLIVTIDPDRIGEYI